MQKYALTFLVVLMSSFGLSAQCESCPAPEGILIDDCYQNASLKGKCAMFRENYPTFYYHDVDNKKSPLEIPLPQDLISPSIPFMMQLASDKSLKLEVQDVLFLRDAIAFWRSVEAVRLWREEAVNEGYVVRESGLAYKVLRHGDGPKPSAGQLVKVHYTGYLADGKKFDSSLDRKQPFTFTLGKGQVIKGWDEGVALMQPGSRFLFRLPPNLAYGGSGAGGLIPPNATLYFDVRYISAQ